jgi:hypothetical protein
LFQTFFTLSFDSTNGDAGDALLYHKGGKFSTFDRDNDDNGGVNCAETFEGAWWSVFFKLTHAKMM